MSLSLDAITALAPDQASLKAANKLAQPKKWPLRAYSTTDPYVWGECQGSGSNPYRTVFDNLNHGYKCTCPSRKFPCKHVLALMWMHVEDGDGFQPDEMPDWVVDWLGRRRNTQSTPKPSADTAKDGKSIAQAMVSEEKKAPDAKSLARSKAAAEKRLKETEASLNAAADDLEQWISDQLRTGVASFLADSNARCRAIAARMVDGKAQALASRLDELPGKLMKLSGEERLNAALQELGKLAILVSAWRRDPSDSELRRCVATSESRESLLENTGAPRVKASWMVVGEEITTRRDGLVSQETWLMALGEVPQFAVLLDFFPASLGKRSSGFMVGDQFFAELVFYPARVPCRAVIAERQPQDELMPWASGPIENPLSTHFANQNKAPWLVQTPMLLPEGALFQAGSETWWCAKDNDIRLPLASVPSAEICGMEFKCSVGLWDGMRLTLLSAETNWGRIQVHG